MANQKSNHTNLVLTHPPFPRFSPVYRFRLWIEYCFETLPLYLTYRPRNGISEEKMSKELGHVPQFVCFKTMYCFILKTIFFKKGFKLQLDNNWFFFLNTSMCYIMSTNKKAWQKSHVWKGFTLKTHLFLKCFDILIHVHFINLAESLKQIGRSVIKSTLSGDLVLKKHT